ncbi:uncharacterized protein LOC142494654 [Ascaphus truei]|uniref:uncharacterized protein LOC142494654 n=1 Tax=Ascaphus truei TaxID=8439 RepID=UPI003F5A3AC3
MEASHRAKGGSNGAGSASGGTAGERPGDALAEEDGSATGDGPWGISADQDRGSYASSGTSVSVRIAVSFSSTGGSSKEVSRDGSLLDVAPEGHVSPETEQVSSPGSASSTHLEEHDEEDYDDDDDDATAIDTQIEASDHEDVPIETVLPANRPANTTYDAIVASEGKIVEAENRRHSDFMTVLERMIALQEETVSQLAHLHRVFIEVPKQLQKINTSFEALVVQQTQANYWRMTNVPQFNTSQPGSVHAGQFSPHSSHIHSPGS